MQPGARRFIRRGRERLVDQCLPERLVGLEDGQQPGDARAQRPVGQPLERLAQDRDAVLVDRPVGPDLGEPERGPRQRLGVAVAAGRGRGLRVAPARGLDVTGGDRRVGEREHRVAALRGRRLGTQRQRLQGLRIVRRGLGMAERRARLVRGLERRLPRQLRIGAGTRRGQRVVRDLRRRHVRARVPAHDQRGGDGLVQRAPAGLGQRLAHGVAHEPWANANCPGAGLRTSPAAVPRSTAAAAAARETPAARTRSGIVKRPATAPTSSTAHASSPSRSTRRRTTSRTRVGTPSSPASSSRTSSAT